MEKMEWELLLPGEWLKNKETVQLKVGHSEPTEGNLLMPMSVNTEWTTLLQRAKKDSNGGLQGPECQMEN